MLMMAIVAPPVSAQALAGLTTWLQRAIGVHALLALMELYAVHQTHDATTAARWARTGARFHRLAWGVVGLGAVAPIALLAVPNTGALLAAAALCLLGLALWEHLYVQAGQKVALT
jgi:hypothetical protein